MKFLKLAAATVFAALFASAALAQNITVGVSWSNFQEERWKTDEAAIVAALDAAGATYVSTDAQSSSAKQLSDIESLIAQGVDALIILAQDAQAIGPAVQAAADEGIPVVAYDRLIEDPRAFYLTFDNVEVGRMQARAVLEAMPSGRYVMIKGSPTDPNADFLRGGQQEVLQAAIDAGDIEIVGEAYTDGWLPANAQRNMEQILTSVDNGVDAVVASNDGTAGGVVAALTAQGMEGIPVSGQDGDHAALNRVALGTQTVSVWKDARDLGRAAGEIAVALAGGAMMSDIDGAQEWTSPGGNPDAAELSGIDTRMLTVKVFALMGTLAALSAVVASARLANHTNDLGVLDELRVIAAAVIGGTALAGEVVGLLGHNGAGKSTLIKMLSGAYKPDGGKIFINGEEATIENPRDARSYNIETIYQTLALADNLDAASNLFLGREIVTSMGLVDDAAMEAETREIMGRLNPNFQKFSAPVSALSGGQRQSVAIARAVYFNARILIMDEPTAALGPHETQMVAELIQQLKAEGIGIFLIDHDVHQVMELCDRASVMKNGKLVGTVNVKDVTDDDLLGMIILGKNPQENAA
eukprot:g17106.t1